MKRSLLLGAALGFCFIGQAHADDFLDGMSARAQWEQYSNALDGDRKIGAFYWAGQRSLPRPGACTGSHEFEAGCFSAQAMLTPIDQRRRSSPEFKRGWNTYQPPELGASGAAAAVASAVTAPSYPTSSTLVPVPNYNAPTGTTNRPSPAETNAADAEQAWAAVLPGVRARCATKWADDFNMQAYCIKEQRTGFDAVQAGPPTRSPAPTRNNNVPPPPIASVPATIPSSSGQNVLGADAIGTIVATSRSNEFQFNRDYKGRLFASSGRFKQAADGLFGIGGRAEFVAQNGQEFDCHLNSDQKVAVAEWQIGKNVLVGGTIFDTTFGDLQLRECQFSSQ